MISERETDGAAPRMHTLLRASGRTWRDWTVLILTVLLVLGSGAATASLAIVYGFDEPPAAWLSPQLLRCMQWLAVLAFALKRITVTALARKRAAEVRLHPVDHSLLVIGGLVVAHGLWSHGASIFAQDGVHLTTIQLLIVVRLVLELAHANVKLVDRQVQPARLLAGSFLFLILVGTVLLALPKASRPVLRGDSAAYQARHVLNCLFTATSATCVTGLVVYDTGTDFTRFGQTVILALIQLGALGIMIFGGVLTVLLGRQISLRESMALQDVVSRHTMGQIGHLVKFIFFTTIAVEAVGAVCLYFMYDDVPGGTGERVFFSVFHSVSAFCNAGFALRADSLIAYRACWQVYGVFIPLIVLGGLGFPALYDVYQVGAARWRRRSRRQTLGESTEAAPAGRIALSMHSRIVLATSLTLIVLGAVLLYLTETPAPYTARHQVRMDGTVIVPDDPTMMCAMGPGERALAALFQSVTARTAGFNTVRTDMEAMSPASHFLLCVLMFIGGSPASTAGGIKTATFAVLLLAVWASLRRRERVEVFSRTIGEETLRRAAVVTVGMFGVVSLLTFLMAMTQSGTLEEILFETVSACGTVGLSTGMTPRLTVFGRVLIIIAMFVGRLGPLTFMIALTGRARAARYEYPEESVAIG